MTSTVERLLNLYQEGGIQSVFEGIRRFVHWRKIRVLRFLSAQNGFRFQFWPSDTRLRAPIFIVGSPRSGTSIFTRNFASHPSLAEWSEAGEIWEPNYSDPTADHLLTKTDVSERDRRRIQTTFLTYTKLRQKERFLNKHPRNSLRIEYIRELFPDAYFIHVVRHPVGPIDSMLRRSKQGERATHPYGRFVKPPGWRDDMDKDDLIQFSLSWKKVNEFLLDHHDNRFQTVRYESLCDDSAGTLNDVCEFVGLDKVFTTENVPEEMINHNQNSIENLTREEYDRLWNIVEPVARNLGYEKSQPDGLSTDD